MKITYMTVAQGLLLVAACLPAAAQMEVNPDHFPDESAPVVQASKPESEINVLRQKLKGYEQQLRAQLEQVEIARQDAISSSVLGDGSQASMYAYQDEQAKAERLQAALTPQIKALRSTIASLAEKDSRTTASSVSTDSRKAKKNNDMLARR